MSKLYQNVAPLFSAQFPKRNANAHKGDFGHVLIIGGDDGMGGATRLAAEAALRVGAGKVSVATRAAHVAGVIAGRPEIMCHGVEKISLLTPLLARATVLVIGCGLGKSKWSLQLLRVALESALPKIVDADALNLLSESPQKQANWILTPHPGEAARLLHCTVETVQANRRESAQKIMDQYGGVVVLKGEKTIVNAENEEPMICTAGNPGMATAGMGDVLSGVMGGLLAQHFALHAAAKTGVLLHAMAGDTAAEKSGERGMIASDLMQYLREFVNPELCNLR